MIRDQASTSQRLAVVRVIDDDEAMRDSLDCLLSSMALEVETYKTSDEFFAGWNPDQPGCLVLDLRMPGMSGLELQERLEREGYQIPIVFISGHGDIASAVKAMQGGATEFLTKPFSENDLLDSVKRAVNQDLVRRQSAADQEGILERLALLTPRERDVLECIVDGLTNREAAERLRISPKTGEMHRSRVLQKMEAKSAVELVKMYLSVYPEANGRRQATTA